MELSPKQQTIELLFRATQCLIITHKQPDGDALGSLLALKIVLGKLGKKVTTVCPNPTPLIFQFLPQINSVDQKITIPNDIIISVSRQKLVIDKLGYRSNEETNALEIVITPKEGTITEKDITVNQLKLNYDAIIVLDTPDVDRLGELYDNHAKLFYETPIINIDHHPSNDLFGRINWVDMVATSTAEILVALIESLAAKAVSTLPDAKSLTLLDEDVATCLLTGIITDTGSFQNINTTPKSLTVAAQLVAAGARQQEIIYHLYKTKPLSTLKLWGAVLTRLTDNETKNFAWTLAKEIDFQSTGAREYELAGLIDELLKTTRDRDFVIVFSERGKTLHGSIRAINQLVDVSAIAALFGGGGHPQAAAFDTPIEKNIEETLNQTLTAIIQHLKSRGVSLQKV